MTWKVWQGACKVFLSHLEGDECGQAGLQHHSYVPPWHNLDFFVHLSINLPVVGTPVT